MHYTKESTFPTGSGFTLSCMCTDALMLLQRYIQGSGTVSGTYDGKQNMKHSYHVYDDGWSKIQLESWYYSSCCPFAAPLPVLSNVLINV